VKNVREREDKEEREGHSDQKFCPTLWDPMNCSPPGSSVDGILQAKILE